jgi:hypothetical protein
MKTYLIILFVVATVRCADVNPDANDAVIEGVNNGYRIRHTNVRAYYNATTATELPEPNSPFYEQDASYANANSGYVDNGDGAIIDSVTGLTWQKNPTAKLTLADAQRALADLNKSAGEPWRIPTIKELFSLIDYSGQVFGDRVVRPFIDTRFFVQPVGDAAKGEREIDAQTWSVTDCATRTMGRDESRYGVNFVDGRVKAYPIIDPATGQPAKMYFRFVRGNVHYGRNKFVDQGNGTILDEATGLMWQQRDSGTPLDWPAALAYANALTLGNHSDWRLPNVKELQSLVQYENNLHKTNQPSMATMFQATARTTPDGTNDYPYYWSSTTLLDGPAPGNQAAYVCFGRAVAFFQGRYVDAHGTGAVRSDPKVANGQSYPQPFGPQGDLQYVRNWVRCVRTAN